MVLMNMVQHCMQDAFLHLVQLPEPAHAGGELNSALGDCLCCPASTATCRGFTCKGNQPCISRCHQVPTALVHFGVMTR